MPEKVNAETGLDQREDMQLAKHSLQIVRGLCKDYGLSFKMPQRSALLSAKKKRADSGEESSSCSEFSSEGEKEGLEQHTRWEVVNEMLEGLHTKQRVKVLKEIHKNLEASSKRAAMRNEELDAIEQEGAASSSLDKLVDQKLLNFKVEETSAAESLRRCTDLVPQLRKRAQVREERKKAMEKAHQEASMQENAGASDADDAGLSREVERKLRALGELPPDADPNLRLVLEAQRAECRHLAHKIKDAEKDLKVKRLALEYVEGRADPGVDLQYLYEAINIKQKMEEQIFAEKREEADRRAAEERKALNLPTEEEVKEAVGECHRLKDELENTAGEIKRMQDSDANRQAGEAEDMATTKSRRGAISQDAWEGGMPNLGMPLDKVTEVHHQLMGEVKHFEERILQEDTRIAAAEDILKTAEKTLTVLDETKLLFLQKVALLQPSVIDNVLVSIQAEAEAALKRGNETPSDDDGSDLESSVGSEQNEEDEMHELLLALGREEENIRTQLSEARLACCDPDSDEEEEEDMKKVATSRAEAHAATDAMCQDIVRLSQRVKAEVAKARGEATGHEELSDDEVDLDRNELKSMDKEEAAAKLKALPQLMVRQLLKQRDENKKLMEKVLQAREEIDFLRQKEGDPEALLGLDGGPGISSELTYGIDTELVAEVRRKVLELRALRNRWWSERQDPGTTVRRALAAASLPDGAEPDQPPVPPQAGLFDRIRESMMLP